jgi:predicted O-methyltransferase YrrM
MTMFTRRPTLKFVEDGRRSLTASQHAEMPVFMHPVEFSQLIAILHSTSPKSVLEWGSGGSTYAVLRLLPGIESYVSIEHNQPWFERVQTMVTDTRLNLQLAVPAEEEPDIPETLPRKKRTPLLKAWFDRCENEPHLMADYVARPGTVQTSYDFILVDGRARNACIKAGYDLLTPGGVLVVHDAQRPEYRETLESFDSHLLLEPWAQGQICVIRK